ncbi:MAG: ImmA/IrrE family metallo-endopeptidase [Lachnospiraceae bacterium]|nr:ImmA/IrrE family metallo-endopeptidase [Lachnospiraceae bacterium]
MNIERLRKIVQYSNQYGKAVEWKVRDFYARIGMNSGREVLNAMQIVSSYLQQQGFLVIELPYKDEELGALTYKGDGMNYILLNSSLPRVNLNFAICHEVYHILYQESGFRSKLELAGDHYYDREHEYSANLFAGMFLMPEENFTLMFTKFIRESKGDQLDTIVRLMSYYQVPFMSALVRCCELDLPELDIITEDFLQTGEDLIRSRFSRLWLDDSILDASGKDDYPRVEALVNQVGEKYVSEGYFNERTMKKVLQNMRGLYLAIKGE